MKWIVDVKIGKEFTKHSEHHFYASAIETAEKLEREYPPKSVIIRKAAGTPYVLEWGGNI